MIKTYDYLQHKKKVALKQVLEFKDEKKNSIEIQFCCIANKIVYILVRNLKLFYDSEKQLIENDYKFTRLIQLEGVYESKPSGFSKAISI